MSFIASFFLTVLALSVAELFLLVRVSAEIGFLATLGLCVLTGVLGGAIVRHQGLQTLGRLQAELAAGRLPADEILDGVALIVLGALLCVPGFLTDALGFLMLVPPLRRRALAWVKRRAAARVTVRMGGTFRAGDFRRGGREIIDAEYEEKPGRDSG